MANDMSVMAVIRASRPSFRNPKDKVAFAVHAFFLASGYNLLAAGRSAFAENALSSSSTVEVGIENWNELENEYAFVYLNSEKGSKKVLVKCLVINETLSVDVVADGASQNVHCEYNVGDYVQENEGSNYSLQFKNLDALVKNLNREVLSKLEGCFTPNPKRELGISDSTGRQPANVGGGNEDLYPGSANRFPVGGGDLYPGPVAGIPSRGGFEDGSMFVGPNDRRFGGVGEPGFPNPRFGGERPFGIPPGARFDPYGLPGQPDFDPDFARRSRIHPDLEKPGSGSDFI